MTGEKTAWLWDAESGTRSRMTAGAANNQLTISPGRSESKLIVFERASLAESAESDAERLHDERPSPGSPMLPLAGSGHVQLSHVDGTERSIILPELVDFNDRDNLKFAGTIIYRKEFTADATRRPRWLDLGPIHAVSQVEMNGKALGVRWYGDHLYEVSTALTPGFNHLEIKVVTTLGDYMKSLTNNPIAQAWTADTPSYPLGLIGPIHFVMG